MAGKVLISAKLDNKEAIKDAEQLNATIRKTANQMVQAFNGVADGGNKSATSVRQGYEKTALSLQQNIQKLEEVENKLKNVNSASNSTADRARDRFERVSEKVNDSKKALERYSKSYQRAAEAEAKAEIQKRADWMQKKPTTTIDTDVTYNRDWVQKRAQSLMENDADAKRLMSSLERLSGKLEDEEKKFNQASEAARRNAKAKLESEQANLTNKIERESLALEHYAQKFRAIPPPADKAAASVKNAAQANKEYGNSTEKATKKSGGFLNQFVKLGTMLKLMVLRKMMHALIRAFQEGFKNLAGASAPFNATMSQMATRMQTMKNSIASAFSPLVSFALPIFNAITNAIVRAMNALAAFNAMLFGNSKTFMKAKDSAVDYAGGVAGAGGAAKKALGPLAAFDELDVLNKDDSGGGGGGGGANVGDMFEEVAVPQHIADFIDKLKAKAQELADIFKQGLADGLDKDFGASLARTKVHIDNIGQSLKEIFLSPEVVNAANSFVETVVYNLGRITGAFASIGATISELLFGSIDKYLSENIEFIKERLVSIFDVRAEISTLVGDWFVAIADIFTVFRSDTAKQIGADLIGIFTDAFLGVEELVSKFTRDVLNLFIQPIVDNVDKIKAAIENTLKPIETITSTLKQAVDDAVGKILKVYDNEVKPVFDSMAETTSRVFGSILDAYNTHVAPLLQYMADGFSSLWQEHIQPLVNNVVEFIGKIAGVVGMLYNQYLAPLVEWLVATLVPILVPIIQTLWDIVGNAIATISDWISGFITFLGGFIDFILGVFTGDWDRAWQGIKGIFDGVIKVIKSLADGFWNFLKLGFELIGNVVSGIVTLMWEKVKKIFDTFKTIVLNVVKTFKDGIEKAWNAIKDKSIDIFTGMKETVVEIFKGLWNGIKGVINSILGGIEKMANGVVNGVNTIIDALNGMGFDIPDWVPGLGGKSFRLSIPTVPSVSIPRLATGAVIPPNKEFMAVLGDQKHGTNLEAPEGLIRQIIREELDGMGRGDVVINARGTMRELIRLLKLEIDNENNRVGGSLIVQG